MADLFGKLKNNLDKGMATVSVKSSTALEINKCKLFIRTLTDKIKEQTNVLGEMVYDMYKNDCFDHEQYLLKCQEINALEEQCQEQEEKIACLKKQETEIFGKQEGSRKAEEGVKVTTNTPSLRCSCGQVLDEDMLFCVNCGNKVK